MTAANSNYSLAQLHEPSSEALQFLLDKQRQAFLAEGKVGLETRLDRLNRLEQLINNNIDALIGAMSKDFGNRSRHQSLMSDIYATLEAIRYQRKNLKKWMRNEKRPAPFPANLLGAKAYIQYQPKGVVGNITPWNFPVVLVCSPLAGMLGAGNRVMLKLSEVSEHTSALLQQLFAKYFASDEVVAITGGAIVGADFSALAFDHLFFTGSESIGRRVLQASAKNLTPTTLELGGKSPAIIGSHCTDPDLGEAALRLITAKALNAGQVCISPDYIFVHKNQLTRFVNSLSAIATKLFPTIINNDDCTGIINERHFNRLQSYLTEAAKQGADIRSINPANEDFDHQHGTFKLPITLVIEPGNDLNIMQEEIFGPIISIKSYDTINEVTEYINARARPLALYYFGNNTHECDFVLNNTTSGQVCLNDAVVQSAVESLPFGGIGHSGMGSYHGIDGFKTFSHSKSVFQQSNINVLKLSGLIPPYGKKTEFTLNLLMRQPKR